MKLNEHRIDAYIFADVAADPVLRELGLKNIKRRFYKSYDVHAVLPKGGKGGAADRMITEAMERMKSDGSWHALMNPYFHEYDDWQP